MVSVLQLYETGRRLRLGAAVVFSVAVHTMILLHVRDIVDVTHASEVLHPASAPVFALRAPGLLQVQLVDPHPTAANAPLPVVAQLHAAGQKGDSSQTEKTVEQEPQVKPSEKALQSALVPSQDAAPPADKSMPPIEHFFKPSEVSTTAHPNTIVDLHELDQPAATYAGQVAILRIYVDAAGRAVKIEDLPGTTTAPDVLEKLIRALERTAFAPANKDGHNVASYVDVALSIDALLPTYLERPKVIL